ncbi:MAG: glycosyltransferase [Deltaproteobacteria bacterium]|jgi:ceramide glucosyltransferase|nr:glycosyltransferase [Deltaproteobacteria bacterium]MBW2530219.1 glycosyltransferase [Deltaproteobacteria bacterium]
MLATLLSLGGAGLLAEVWRSHRQLARPLQPGAEANALVAYPAVTVIRPIRGLDAGARDNIRAALDTGYPGHVQTLFVLDDEREPAVPLIREAIADRAASGEPVDARVIFCGKPPAGRTGKLNAMIVGYRHADGEVIVFADSDIRPDRDALRVLVETLLSRPDAGASFAPTVAVEPPRTAGDVGYSLLLNGLYGPAFAYVAHQNGGQMPFIMGQFMAMRREAIAAIGGLECADGQLVDDMYLGLQIVEAGYRNLVSPRSVPIIQHDLAFADFVSTYVRWITFSRSGLPGRTFKLISWLRGAVFWAGLVLAVVAASQGLWAAAAVAAAVPMASAASINVLHRSQGGGALRFQHLWVSFALVLTAPLVMLWIFTHREVTWRGRTYSLNAASRLASSDSGPSPALTEEPAPISSIIVRPASRRGAPPSLSEPVSVSTTIAS